MKEQLLLIVIGMLVVSIGYADHQSWHARKREYRQPQVHRQYNRSPSQFNRQLHSQPFQNRGIGLQQGPVNGGVRVRPSQSFQGNYPASTGFGATPWSLGFGFGPASGAAFGQHRGR